MTGITGPSVAFPLIDKPLSLGGGSSTGAVVTIISAAANTDGAVLLAANFVNVGTWGGTIYLDSVPIFSANTANYQGVCFLGIEILPGQEVTFQGAGGGAGDFNCGLTWMYR